MTVLNNSYNRSISHRELYNMFSGSSTDFGEIMRLQQFYCVTEKSNLVLLMRYTTEPFSLFIAPQDSISGWGERGRDIFLQKY